MSRKVVHHDDVPKAQSREEDLLDVGAEDLRVGGSVYGHAAVDQSRRKAPIMVVVCQ
ncbi:MAG TPA: hypothetical protein VGO67_17560 [Verrucomicrobiae bacterium]